MPQHSLFDKLIISFDQALKAVANTPAAKGTPYPAKNIEEADLSDSDRKKVAALMRINHAGEVCAQALYHGQGFVSKSDIVQTKLEEAAIEEGDHLNWCKQRLDELGSRTSYLAPLWYAGSFGIGMVAGMVGDKWSLGFLAETEHQVSKHLEGHMHLLPQQDQRSYVILQRMQSDEARHKEDAIELGANELPDFIKKMMAFTSKVMVKTAYWI